MASKDRRGRWRARAYHQGLRFYLGTYPTKEEAEKVECHFNHTHKVPRLFSSVTVQRAAELIGEEQVKLLHRHGISLKKMSR